MSDSSFHRFGGLCAVLLALAALAYAGLLVLDTGAPGLAERLLQASAARGLNQTASLLLAVVGVLTMVGAAAVYERVAEAGRSWARWAAALGVVGGAMTAAHGYWDYVRVPILLAQWNVGDLARRAAIATFAGVPNPVDPRGLGALLFVGLFALVAGRLILVGGAMPAYVGWLGLAYGALLVLSFLSGMYGPALIRAGLAGLAMGIVGPIWWLLVGWELLRGRELPSTPG